MGLSDGGKSFQIGFAVSIQYRSVTASHPTTQPPSHVAVAITHNALAKASSLKSVLTYSVTKDPGRRKFSVVTFAPTNENTEERKVPEPIFRY